MKSNTHLIVITASLITIFILIEVISFSPLSTANLDFEKEMFLSVWNKTGFHSEFDSYVDSEPYGYGAYDVHQTNLFNRGDTLLLYVEPAGFSHKRLVSEKNDTLYSMNFTADVLVSNNGGKLIASKENIPIREIVSHHKNTELYLTLAINQTIPFPTGDYTFQYFITDQNSGKNFKIVKDVRISI